MQQHSALLRFSRNSSDSSGQNRLCMIFAHHCQWHACTAPADPGGHACMHAAECCTQQVITVAANGSMWLRLYSLHTTITPLPSSQRGSLVRLLLPLKGRLIRRKAVLTTLDAFPHILQLSLRRQVPSLLPVGIVGHQARGRSGAPRHEGRVEPVRMQVGAQGRCIHVDAPYFPTELLNPANRCL